MHPPTPVAAPPYGSMADGRLCVSTLKATPYSSSKAITPALSLNTDRHVGPRPSAISSAVARPMVSFSRLAYRISAGASEPILDFVPARRD